MSRTSTPWGATPSTPADARHSGRPPAGLEDYFRELGVMLASPGVPDFAAIAALSEQYALVGREDWIPGLV
jgi:hypothetical protein